MLKFHILEEEELYYLCSENRGADQLCSYFVLAYLAATYSTKGGYPVTIHLRPPLCLIGSYCFILVEAQKLEKISLQHIQDLLHRVEEVVGLLTILVDHQFHVLASTLTQVCSP